MAGQKIFGFTLTAFRLRTCSFPAPPTSRKTNPRAFQNCEFLTYTPLKP